MKTYRCNPKMEIDFANQTDVGFKSSFERYSLLVWCFVLVVFIIIGSVIIILATVTYKAMRVNKISVVLIQNIAVNDLMIFVFGVLPSIVSLIGEERVYGETLCFVFNHIYFVLTTSAAVFICALQITKLHALRFPLTVRMWTKTCGCILAISMWFYSFVVPVVIISRHRESLVFDYRIYFCMINISQSTRQSWVDILFLSLLILPNLMIVFTTIMLLVKVKKCSTRVNLRSVLAALISGVVFIFTYAPMMLIFNIGARVLDNIHHTPDRVNRAFFIYFMRLSFYILPLNSACNVIVYAATFRSFRIFLFNFIIMRLWNRLYKLSGIGR